MSLLIKLCLQLVLVQISEMAAFGMTFEDCDFLANLKAELNNMFAVQFYSSHVQQSDSVVVSEQVPILAVNALPGTAEDSLAV